LDPIVLSSVVQAFAFLNIFFFFSERIPGFLAEQSVFQRPGRSEATLTVTSHKRVSASKRTVHTDLQPLSRTQSRPWNRGAHATCTRQHLSTSHFALALRLCFESHPSFQVLKYSEHLPFTTFAVAAAPGLETRILIAVPHSAVFPK
jgi:hypothetical protein